jgi:hypothetical protein
VAGLRFVVMLVTAGIRSAPGLFVMPIAGALGAARFSVACDS